MLPMSRHPLPQPWYSILVALLAYISASLASASAVGEEQPESPAPDTAENAASPAATDADMNRIRDLLRQHYSGAGATTPQPTISEAAQEEQAPELASYYDWDTVVLNREAGRQSLLDMGARLNDSTTSSQGQLIDINYHVEVRRGGTLVHSASHSLRALGKYQYIGRLLAPGGELTINVRRDNWTAALPDTAEGDFLVTFYVRRKGLPELHLIAVADVKADDWDARPHWLPYLGSLPARTPSASSSR